MTKWLESIGGEEDVVVSTRLRIARNINQHRFPSFIDLEESEAITQEVFNAIKDKEENYKLYRTKDLTSIEKNMFVEDHLISPSLSQSENNGSFLLREDEKATIMINEEDHIRIQVLLSGLNTEKSWDIISEIDDILEEKIDYAFHEQFGYLTSCPTNVGTGLRASVMVHLPSLGMTGQIRSIVESLTKIGLTVRGLYGEGSKSLGNLYQISNQNTIGEKEEDIIKKLNKIVYQIVNRERSTRKYLLERKNINLKDKVFRSLGILHYSKLMTVKEAMDHLSNIKLGVDTGIIENIKSKDVLKLMIEIQPANLQKDLEEKIPKEEIDILRAEIIGKKLISLEGK